MLFDVHANEVNKKAMGILMYINIIVHYPNRYTRIIVVQTLVLSLFDYYIRIWGTASDAVLSSAQKLQNFAARVAMGGVRKYDNISLTFNELKWLRLKQRRI